MEGYIVLILITFFDLTYQTPWNYQDEDQWPGKCSSGIQQSPINIVSSDALIDHHGTHIREPLIFRGYGEVELQGVNNGHTLQYNRADGATPILSGGPLEGNYTLLQFHFHWLSEHALDGMKFPLEVHLVHLKTGLTLEQAVTRPDGLAVVGVFFEVQTNPGSYHALEQIVNTIPDLVDKTNGDQFASTSMDISRLLSNDRQSFFTYHGSLTTPHCQEVVTWIVMDRPLTIADTQYRMFTRVNVGGMANYRSLQQVNRVVYRSVASCSSIMVPSILAFLLNLFACSTSSITAAVKKGICTVVNVKKKIFGDALKECFKVS